MNLSEIKSNARKAAFLRRRIAFDNAQLSQSARLSEVLAGFRGVSLAGYLPIRTEIDPLPAMVEAAVHGEVSVPVIQGKGEPLKFSVWEPDISLRVGPFGVQVPLMDVYTVPDLVIVPLVAFDIQGGRLGYGGGFYDRSLEWLKNHKATVAVGFAFDAQETTDLPLESTDQRLDMVVTETRVIKIS
ncbi:5-formyltetrahydrofolate cyclo-ligase [Pseudopelagicola sp. nBUS_19]|uniref:5-formyltetrahydrofolate cyclo-ligase n=1 Tax=Pseudopelagicola sp. nBUS_19 TaxID=3395316 RepID=UPI003EBD92F9